MSSARRPYLAIFLIGLLLASFFLGGCAADDDAEDLRPPALTFDALDPSRFESQKELSGTVDDNAELEVSVNTSAEVGEIVVENGVWRTTITGLEPGNNQVTVSAQDDFNTRSLFFNLIYNIAQVEQFRSVVDTATTTVFGEMIPEGSIVSAELNGLELLTDPITTGPWSIDLANLQVGTNTLAIDAVGPAGQTQEIALTITRDSDAVPMTIGSPVLTGDDLELSGTVDIAGEVDIRLDTESVGTVTYSDPDANTQNWTAHIDDLEEGDSLLTVTATPSTETDSATAASGQVLVFVETDPEVVSMNPSDLDTGVALDAAVTANFNQAVVGSTVNEESFLLSDGSGSVPGTVSYDAEAMAAVFTPDMALDPLTDYTAELTGAIVDPTGNPIPPEVWSFTTVE